MESSNADQNNKRIEHEHSMLTTCNRSAVAQTNSTCTDTQTQELLASAGSISYLAGDHGMAGVDLVVWGNTVAAALLVNGI
ncbi:hypothetical protein TrVGV298_011944 [Trichoderma virens]|nr:hypothetical protein TrVGV298_011944 [Trichoderma virens]